MHPFACACEVFDLESVTKLREQIDEREASALEAREEIDRLELELATLRQRQGDPEEVAEAMVRETTSGCLSWITDPIEREAWLDRARAAIGAMSDAPAPDLRPPAPVVPLPKKRAPRKKKS